MFLVSFAVFLEWCIFVLCWFHLNWSDYVHCSGDQRSSLEINKASLWIHFGHSPLLFLCSSFRFLCFVSASSCVCISPLGSLYLLSSPCFISSFVSKRCMNASRMWSEKRLNNNKRIYCDQNTTKEKMSICATVQRTRRALLGSWC